MTVSGGQAVVQALEDEEVPFVFGVPGTHNIELYDALSSSTVTPILVSDERSAPFMADAAWRASGRLSCVSLVPGAGLTHSLSGIAEARLDHAAMLILACGIRRDSGRSFQLHDVDQLALAAPVTKAASRVGSGDELYAAVRRACRLARDAPAGPVLLEVPAELYLARSVKVARRGRELPPSPPTAAPSDLARAAEVLNAARRVLVYAGAGAARADLVALAERLEAPVATTLQGKGVFPETHPLWLWPGFGDAAPAFAREVAASCDATLALGCRFGEVGTGSYGVQPPRPLVHVDVDPQAIGRNYAADVAVTADAGEVVAGVLPLLVRRAPDAALRERIAAGRAPADAECATPSPARVSPGLLLAELQRTFGPDTVFVTDSGNGTFLAAECLRLDRPGRFLAPVDFSCMGYAVPGAIGAKLACPKAPVVALAGDGAFLMTGLELLTAAAQGLPVIVVLLRDGELAQIAQFQRAALGRTTCSVLPAYDARGLALSLGVEVLALERDVEVAPVLSAARAAARAGRPVLVEAQVDYARKTFLTRGVVKTSFLRLPWPDRLRFAGRAIGRRLRAAIS